MHNFKFQIGDLVYLRQGVEDSRLTRRLGVFAIPFAFIVIERISQECPGGVQLQYKLHGGNPPGSVISLEIEMMPIADLDIKELLAMLQKLDK